MDFYIATHRKLNFERTCHLPKYANILKVKIDAFDITIIDD